MATIENIQKLIVRDLDRTVEELGLYKDEANLWLKPEGINNSAGNLMLHLCGNLKHFIGALLGDTGYIRKRDEEFSLKDIPATYLKTNLEETKAVVERTLSGMQDNQLEEDFPIEMFGSKQTIGFMLLHLATHLNYHLGQINYHRRLLEG